MTNLMANRDFSGMWRCMYWYPSNKKEGELLLDEYVVQAQQQDDKVIFESLPGRPNHMVVNLTISESLATGAWVESTDPAGEFAGLEYSGAVQLLVQADNNSMLGAWVGVGREHLPDGTFEPKIYTGKWELHRLGTGAQK